MTVIVFPVRLKLQGHTDNRVVGHRASPQFNLKIQNTNDTYARWGLGPGVWPHVHRLHVTRAQTTDEDEEIAVGVSVCIRKLISIDVENQSAWPRQAPKPPHTASQHHQCAPRPPLPPRRKCLHPSPPIPPILPIPPLPPPTRKPPSFPQVRLRRTDQDRAMAAPSTMAAGLGAREQTHLTVRQQPRRHFGPFLTPIPALSSPTRTRGGACSTR